MNSKQNEKEIIGAYSEDAVDEALVNLVKWCGLHKSEFIDRARLEFDALCGDEVSFTGIDEVAKKSLNLIFTDWVTFDSRVFEYGCIDEYLCRAEMVSEQDRAILSEMKDTERFGFFRYEGAFDDGDGDMGIFISDALDGDSFKVYSTFLHDIAIGRSYKLGTGLSVRVAIIGSRAYFVGQFPSHDRAIVAKGETLNLYRICRKFKFPFVVMMAACLLSPNGMFANSAVCNLVRSNA